MEKEPTLQEMATEEKPKVEEKKTPVVTDEELEETYKKDKEYWKN
jgi:hypothetical protein